MAAATQDTRPMKVTTPLGKDVMLLGGFAGREGISQLFHFQLNVLVENDAKGTTPKPKKVSIDDLLGQGINVEVEYAEGKKRYFHGICNRISQGAVSNEFTAYQVELVPQFWLLTRMTQSRTFQPPESSVPDILKKVLKGLNVEFKLEGTFQPRDYCVQYRESDFSFACRIMEEEGIYYYFKHENGKHTMVVANTPNGHVTVPSPSSIQFHTIESQSRPDDVVTEWTKIQELRAGKYTLWDYCFEKPTSHLDADSKIQETVQAGTVSHKLKVTGNGQLEVYEFPGGYAQRFDGVDKGGADKPAEIQKIFDDNKRTVGIRMQEEASASVQIQGVSGCGQLTAGHKFTLQKHFNGDGDYILSTVQHSARDIPFRGSSGGYKYDNSFTCIPVGLPFRPPRVTQRPVVGGTQTAVVVGPAGEEIFTDKYGRIKVQFHWDRDGKNNADSSCWVRVGTVWAGQQWGAIHIPRIGQEVIVAFEDGDPDRPIVVGSVYNADNMPPYKLPDNKTQSGIKSRSALKGTAENFNELRFEDKKDSEEIYFHAEKDFNRVVENNDSLKVGFEKHDKGDQTIEIFNKQDVTVGAGKDKADDGSQTVSIWNSQKLTIGAGKAQAKEGSQTVSIYKDRDVQLEQGNDILKIKMGNQTTKLDLGASSTEAMQSIELKVGQNSIVIDQTGITIKGMMISIQGQVQTEIKGVMTTVNGDGMLTLKGGLTMIN